MIQLDCTVSSFIIYHNITPSDVSIARKDIPASSFFLLHLALIYIKIRIDLLDVVVVVEGFVEFQHGLGIAAG